MRRGDTNKTDADSNDDSVKSVHFDDSEEERNLGLDDGFDVGGRGDVGNSRGLMFH